MVPRRGPMPLSGPHGIPCRGQGARGHEYHVSRLERNPFPRSISTASESRAQESLRSGWGQERVVPSYPWASWVPCRARWSRYRAVPLRLGSAGGNHDRPPNVRSPTRGAWPAFQGRDRTWASSSLSSRHRDWAPPLAARNPPVKQRVSTSQLYGDGAIVDKLLPPSRLIGTIMAVGVGFERFGIHQRELFRPGRPTRNGRRADLTRTQYPRGVRPELLAQKPTHIMTRRKNGVLPVLVEKGIMSDCFCLLLASSCTGVP
ncbi:uncharacterized protein B0I36DRAFT_316011 [Microdochium trichocladiopsis]|uniref:Uncharacterized protein n=1 Tax=Microdochium trichocladiopsis TaxID=1682393 RepID=A0A9P9BVA7_9PEZI|nr:uncharacterized protein B0I36DRAFT_316011 [Microdochium trichocladiopsis]KAH7038324.1 hypothetical protein B0I36DRAFT_316011 [Microdochium trichocladiopsis]